MTNLHLVDCDTEPEPADAKQQAREAITAACRSEVLNPLELVEHLLALVTREVDLLKHALQDLDAQ